MIDTTESKLGPKRMRQMARESRPAGEAKVLTSRSTPRVESGEAEPASKSSLVLQMLQRPEGATIAQLVAATGWLSHTTRAALTGLKKKGHQVTSEKAEGEERVYRVVAD